MNAKTYRWESGSFHICLFICHTGKYISTEHLSWAGSIKRINELQQMGYTYAKDNEVDEKTTDFIERICCSTRY